MGCKSSRMITFSELLSWRRRELKKRKKVEQVKWTNKYHISKRVEFLFWILLNVVLTKKGDNMVILMLNRKKLLEKTHLKSFSQIRFSVQKDNTKGYLTKRLKEFFDQGQTTITLKKLFFTQNVVYQIGFMFLIPFRNVPN